MAKELKRASLVRRLCAYAIDYLIVVILVSLISAPFIDAKKIDKLQNESTEVIEKYQKGEITPDEYLERYSSVYYSLSRSTGVMTFITIIIYIVYFVVFQLYNKGQTLGKKVMKIKVVSTNGELSMNQMIFRSFIANSILLNILSIMFLMMAPRHIYFACVGLFSFIQYAVVIISVFMIKFSKNGLTVHDRLLHTKVIKLN